VSEMGGGGGGAWALKVRKASVQWKRGNCSKAQAKPDSKEGGGGVFSSVEVYSVGLGASSSVEVGGGSTPVW